MVIPLVNNVVVAILYHILVSLLNLFFNMRRCVFIRIDLFIGSIDVYCIIVLLLL